MAQGILATALAGVAMAVATAAHPNEVGSVHQDLRIALDPTARELRAEVQIRMEGGGRVPLALDARYDITRFTLDGRAIGLPGREQDGVRMWDLELTARTTHRVVLHYHGRVDRLTHTDHRGTLRALPPMADPRGSYLPAGSGWYPQLASDTFTYRVELALPAGQRGLVPGALVSEQDGPAGYRASYVFAQPAEGIELMAGPYHIRERMLVHTGAPDIRLRTWFHPELEDLADGYLDALGRYLELYGRWIGDYPFTEFSVVSAPLPTGLGMPTLTYLGIDVLRLPFIKSTSLGHEVLHNWWGNGVYVDYDSGNWCEGLTTFMADYFYKEQEGAQAAYAMRQSWLRDLAAIPPGRDMPLTAFTARTHGTSQIVGYHKAALVFLMLRERIGAAAFDAGVREFWKQHRFERAGWDDLRRAFEHSSGAKLEAFFAQWLTRTGAPNIRIENASREADRLTVHLVQSEPAYLLRVPLKIDTAAGPRALAVDMSSRSQTFTMQLDALPQAVALDPQLLLLRRLEARELPPILRQVMIDPATVSVLASPDDELGLAARELASSLQDSAPRFVDTPTGAPLLVIGRHADVDRFLATHDLPARPDIVTARSTAQVWTAYQSSGAVLAVVSAADAAALRALLRPLPHYGGQSWLIFEGRKALEHGVWSAETPSFRLQ